MSYFLTIGTLSDKLCCFFSCVFKFFSRCRPNKFLINRDLLEWDRMQLYQCNWYFICVFIKVYITCLISLDVSSGLERRSQKPTMYLSCHSLHVWWVELCLSPRSNSLMFAQTQRVRAAVLKSHLRPLKRSLDMRPPTSGVRRRGWRAKVLTQDNHKGILIGHWSSFEGNISQSQLNCFNF